MNDLQNNPEADYALPANTVTHPAITRFFAHLVSYIFHPLFIPLYATYYLAFMHPGYFIGISTNNKIWVLLRVANNMVFFPAVLVLLLKGVGFIDSIFLKTQKERIIPYIASGTFFFLDVSCFSKSISSAFNINCVCF